MAAVRQIVIDVLIPEESDEIECVQKLCALEGIDGATLYVDEVDDRTKTVEIVIEGESLDYPKIKAAVEDFGGSIHSIDRVSAGSIIVD